jgi:hypothetical protein
VLVSFLSLWQATWEKQHKGGKVYFDSWFQSIVSWVHCFWAHDESHHHGRRMCQRKAPHLMSARKQREKGLGQDLSFKGTPSVTHFLQLKFLLRPRSTPIGDQAFNTWAFEGCSRSKHNPTQSPSRFFPWKPIHWLQNLYSSAKIILKAKKLKDQHYQISKLTIKW